VLRPGQPRRAIVRWRRCLDRKTLIDGGEHLIEAGHDDDLDQGFRSAGEGSGQVMKL
jgi:hypothetical protein